MNLQITNEELNVLAFEAWENVINSTEDHYLQSFPGQFADGYKVAYRMMEQRLNEIKYIDRKCTIDSKFSKDIPENKIYIILSIAENKCQILPEYHYSQSPIWIEDFKINLVD